jgi:CD2 antigen cytoplasmic tail-binding protein 2
VRSQADDDVAGLQSKKPRFDIRNPSALAPDAAEDDAILDADVIGGRGQNVRRNAVNIDGYDSDSDNENFDSRAASKAKRNETTSKDEEDDDMFADLADDFKDGDESDGDAARKGGKKKAVRFLDEDEIEGQVKNSKSGGHVSADFTLNGKGKSKAVRDEEMESSTDSDVDDEVRASTTNDIDEEIGAGGKKTHAPKLDAFNMKNEQEEGRFDDQGNYVRKAADADAVHDTWLEGVSKKDMKKAKEAADKREEERRKKAIEDDSIPTGDVLSTLIPFLERGETVLEALARLGKGKEKKPRWQIKSKNQKKKPNGHAMDTEMGDEDSAEAKRRNDVEAITGAADLLLTRGQPEIYDAERELLVRQYKKETGEEWKEPKQSNGTGSLSTKMWKYRWSDARDGGQIHGPYDGATMVAWNDAGYFGEGVEFQQQDGAEWSRTVDFI